MFTTNPQEIDISLKKNKCILSRLEGDLKIYLDNNLYFNESGILLAELCIEILRWLKDLDENFKVFQYWTIDYSEAPIIEIVQLGEGYRFNSVWGLRSCEEKFDAGYIVNKFKELSENLIYDIKKNYGVNIMKFM